MLCHYKLQVLWTPITDEISALTYYDGLSDTRTWPKSTQYSLTNNSWDDERAVNKLDISCEIDLLGLGKLDEEVQDIEALHVAPFTAVHLGEHDLISECLHVHASGDLIIRALELSKSSTGM